MSVEISNAIKTFTVGDVALNPEARHVFDLYYLVNPQAESLEVDSVIVLSGYDYTLIQCLTADGGRVTYRTLTEHYDQVLDSIAMIDVEADWKANPPAFVKYVTRDAIFGGKTSIDLPLEQMAGNFAPHPTDETTGDDLAYLDSVCDAVTSRTKELVASVTKLAEQVGNAIVVKDHDLYLAFKGSESLKHMVVSLEKVYPELPESGVLSIGDTPLSEDQFKDITLSGFFHVKKIIKQVKSYNRLLDIFRMYLGKTPGKAALLEDFNKHVRTQLVASSHFLKQLYGFDMRFAEKMVYKAAADIIDRLDTRGGDIALDLNSWVVWDYSAPEMPTRCLVPELNFKDIYMNRRTDSFMEALYGVLLNTPHPRIKPYSRREIVSGDDGIAIGTIFPVNQPPEVKIVSEVTVH